MNFGGGNSRFYLWFSYNNISNIRRKTVHISLNFIFKFPLFLLLDHKFLNLLRLKINHNGRSWFLKFYLTKKKESSTQVRDDLNTIEYKFKQMFFSRKFKRFLNIFNTRYLTSRTTCMANFS